jgi:hypothetical protein
MATDGLSEDHKTVTGDRSEIGYGWGERGQMTEKLKRQNAAQNGIMSSFVKC